VSVEKKVLVTELEALIKIKNKNVVLGDGLSHLH